MANNKNKKKMDVKSEANSHKYYFKYVVLVAVLIIPFMYSFFYLKAYWNPYGKGNIDNLPVAIVNSDEGDKGTELIDSIKSSGKLKISVVSDEDASKGLDDEKYYAVIKIPSDFTSSMESAGTTIKKHATITYSPNQKANYLASQIINNVVNVVEKNLDNSVNSNIIGSLVEKLNSVPSKLQIVSDGFDKLQNGVNELNTGSNTLAEGTASLKENYNTFNNGLETLSNGANELNNAASGLSSVSSSVDELVAGVNTLTSNSEALTSGVNNYVTGVNQVLDFTSASAQYIVTLYEQNEVTHNGVPASLYMNAKGLLTNVPNYGNVNTIAYLKGSGKVLSTNSTSYTAAMNTLNTKVGGLTSLKDSIQVLQNSINTLASGSTTLYENSKKINEGIISLNDGAVALNNGIGVLNTSVISAKNELNSNIESTKEELKVLDGLEEYSNEPVSVDTKEVNKISSYGTAFSPFFISIALWVGCLMMYIVLYYDKNERFKILGINNKNRVQRTLCYHALITVSAIALGISLELFLDFEITNQFLYFASIVLIGNAFMAIMEFLIVNFGDVGKFLALIILVLQLAAAGGTFPIETVTEGFRWMHSFLPMTYTIRLLREALVTIESNLLTSNLIIVSLIFVFFFVANIVSDFVRQNKNK